MRPIETIHPSWNFIIPMLEEQPLKKLNNEIIPHISINPDVHDIFRVFEQPMKNVKVVILGQDPYPNPKYATGYAYAIPEGLKSPPTLNAIKAEVYSSVNGNAELLKWVEQGVLLLNTALTVERGKPGSHLNYWRPFMQRVISTLSEQHPCIWMLWGNHAQSYRHYIRNRVEVKGYDRQTISLIPIGPGENQILSAAHPASEEYESGKFFGTDHFYLANKILSKKRIQTISW